MTDNPQPDRFSRRTVLRSAAVATGLVAGGTALAEPASGGGGTVAYGNGSFSVGERIALLTAGKEVRIRNCRVSKRGVSTTPFRTGSRGTIYVVNPAVKGKTQFVVAGVRTECGGPKTLTRLALREDRETGAPGGGK